jgi:hypothetical protein
MGDSPAVGQAGGRTRLQPIILIGGKMRGRRDRAFPASPGRSRYLLITVR